MNKKQLKIWERIYSTGYAISNLEPWKTIKETDILFYVTEDQKNICFFKIWGHSQDFFGFSCYFDAYDFTNAHNNFINKNKKNEPVMYMQNAITGIWDDVSRILPENKSIMTALKIKHPRNEPCLHFEEYEEQQLPHEVCDFETEPLADALGNLYMMLKAIIKDGLKVNFQKGEALMRKYAGNGTWHNMPVPWRFFAEEFTLTVKLENNSTLKDIKKMPVGNFSVELDARCLPTPVYDEENDIDFFPYLITAVDNNTGFVFSTKTDSFDDDLTIMLFECLTEICFKFGKPEGIIINDERVQFRIEDFCKKAGLKIIFQKKKLKNTEAAIKDMFEYLSKNYNQEEDAYEIENEIDYDDYDEKYWTSDSYIISVSLYTGCYRHIRVSGCLSLEELHETILNAFEFDDDHAHAFFLNNKKWTPGGYYSSIIEDEEKFTCDYTLEKVLSDKQQFVYVFDFGEEWTFKCKVLKVLPEPTFEPEIVRSAGDSPSQY